MSSTSIELNDTYGTTLVIIRTPKLVVFTSDSRATQTRSGRVVSDGEIKYEKITSTVYATGTGSSFAARKLYKEVQEKYDQKKSRVEPTLKEITEYALERVNKMQITSGSAYAFIGIENGRPEAYTFVKDNPCQESVDKVTEWWAAGSGSSHAKILLDDLYKGNLAEAPAVELGKTALSLSVVADPFTGGFIRVLVFDSKGLRMCSSKSITTLEAYLTYYEQWNNYHPSTFYIFSLGRISDAAVTQWFRSGCLIKQVDVMFVHAIGQVQGYHVRRVVLKDEDPSTVIEEVQNLCDAYGCCEETNKEITTFPCLSILNAKFYFAQLTKEKLSKVCGYTF